MITNRLQLTMRTIKIVFSFSFLILVIITSCKKNEVVITEDLPICIEEIVMDSIRSAALKTVQAIVAKNEIHYWLNTDARHADGGELIVNQQCEEVCSMCGNCVFPKCLKKYNMEEWQIIWQP